MTPEEIRLVVQEAWDKEMAKPAWRRNLSYNWRRHRAWIIPFVSVQVGFWAWKLALPHLGLS